MKANDVFNTNHAADKDFIFGIEVDSGGVAFVFQTVHSYSPHAFAGSIPALFKNSLASTIW